MIISRTPFRISFFGGGTDYPAWYRREGGAVLSTTIDKYLYITCRYLPPFFPQRHRIVWSKIENVASIQEIQHPAIRSGLDWLGFNDTEGPGLDIHYQGDLPARSGMGSSSAFAVGLLNALSALKGQRVTKRDLALRAISLEQDLLSETVGAQDQTAAAYGGLNHIEFQRSGDIVVTPMVTRPDRLRQLEDSLMLFYSGISRFASEIAADVVVNLESKRQSLLEMRLMVDQAIDILSGDGSLDHFGTLLHQAWMHKRQLSARVSNGVIDGMYDLARANGALGGKLLGAGESGFMLFFVPPDKQASVRKALSNYLHVPFRFSWQGSTIIHYDPENYDLGAMAARSLNVVEPSGG